jgi:CheY-like chemotaxis protein
MRPYDGVTRIRVFLPGGRSVAKILVADDNSNIQKMVGLALKDHGIEVVAVGNGEAAVRKAADMRPDLILADVFMPVRNGYEVCQYVKNDPALGHIPVILLVGAFDPLDEQEAQRVRADGVLKKPFVPPDPLISMVKSALVRAGVAHAGFSPPKPAGTAPAEVPATSAAQKRNGKPKLAPKDEPAAKLAAVSPESVSPDLDESFVDEVPARPAEFKIEAGPQPVAFGSLLETPATDAEEEPSEVTAVPALERDWRTEEVEEEEDEESEADAKLSWRRDGGSDLPEQEAAEGETAASSNGWRDAASQERSGHGRQHSSWTPTREKSDLTEAAEVQENVHSGISDFRNMPTVPFSGEAWAAAIQPGVQNRAAVAEEEHPVPHAAELEALVGHTAEGAVEQESFTSEVPAAAPDHFASQELGSLHATSEQLSSPEVDSQELASQEVADQDSVAETLIPETMGSEQPSSEHGVSAVQVSELENRLEPGEIAPVVVPRVPHAAVAAIEPEKISSTSSWFSPPPPSPWDVEAQKATKLASTWDAPITPAIPEASAQEVAAGIAEEGAPEVVESASSFATGAAPDEIEVVSSATTNSLIPEAIEGAREEASQESPDETSEVDMDAVVARVLARMSPERLKEVTRELLKPVIETIVREELNKRS